MNSQQSRPQILIVEDEPDIRLAIQLFLESEGFKTRLAANGREALDDIEAQGAPSLILLDMKMPVMNGWDFAHAFYQRYDHLAPIIVMSAAADAESRAAGIHADGWVGKPFGLSELMDKIKSVAARAHASSPTQDPSATEHQGGENTH